MGDPDWDRWEALNALVWIAVITSIIALFLVGVLYLLLPVFVRAL